MTRNTLSSKFIWISIATLCAFLVGTTACFGSSDDEETAFLLTERHYEMAVYGDPETDYPFDGQKWRLCSETEKLLDSTHIYISREDIVNEALLRSFSENSPGDFERFLPSARRAILCTLAFAAPPISLDLDFRHKDLALVVSGVAFHKREDGSFYLMHLGLHGITLLDTIGPEGSYDHGLWAQNTSLESLRIYGALYEGVVALFANLPNLKHLDLSPANICEAVGVQLLSFLEAHPALVTFRAPKEVSSTQKPLLLGCVRQEPAYYTSIKIFEHNLPRKKQTLLGILL
ncbi:MAG: hypothetical protein LCH26_06065 [Proteobacteria bacterium]|nr:hypothetical protein [Pseudomonadota bacterium]